MKNVLLALLAMTLAPLANATTYRYADFDVELPNGASFDAIFAEYDTSTSTMTFAVDNLNKGGALLDGFWLVTNDGSDNPVGEDGLAILYADFNTSSLWAFAYNGENDPTSYSSTDYLGDFSSGIFSAGTVQGITLDVSSIYANLATNGPFDELIGIWFHPTWNTMTETDATGRLVDWEFSSQTWLDIPGWGTTTVVPVPGALLLYACALFGLGLVRKAKHA